MDTNAVQETYLRDFQIIQDMIFGYDISTVSQKFNVSVEHVADLIASSPHFAGLTASHRKSLALARLDVMAKSLIGKAAGGDIGAINTYLKVQEREARLTGMEAPIKTDGKLTVEISWLTPDRLSYKNPAGEVIENVTDITPILDVKKVAEGRSISSAPWREPAPDGLAKTMRDYDKKD